MCAHCNSYSFFLLADTKKSSILRIYLFISSSSVELGAVFATGDIWQCLESFLVIPTGKVLLASSG